MPAKRASEYRFGDVGEAELRVLFGNVAEENQLRAVIWPGSRYPVIVRLGKAPNGRVVCGGLLLGGGAAEVTASSLREIPLGEIVDELSRQQTAADQAGLPNVWYRPTRLGPRGTPRERFEEIARLYRQALQERPSAPVQWMSERIRSPEDKPTPAVTVRRWLQRCRDLDLLGPSIPGKAGEQPRTTRRRRR